jgi:riboflavin kinase / FMN adenylyltransferase
MLTTVHANQPVPSALLGGVVAIGNFDGVHLGHQALFEIARKRALDLSVPFIVLTFAPHPRQFFKPGSAPFLLTPGNMKFERCTALKADGVVILNFDQAMADHTPQAFIAEILKDRLQACHVVVGRDFHFGHDRLGTAETIMDAGIPVTMVDVLCDATNTPYTSTRIRILLQQGDIVTANQLLGWNWFIDGVVVHGDKRGRELGYPTANIALNDTLHPAYGIYAAWVQIEGETILRPAALNIGIRPMFTTKTALLEAHLLNFDGDLYGRHLRVQPVEYLREEARFPDLDSLKIQMQEDCRRAGMILASYGQKG